MYPYYIKYPQQEKQPKKSNSFPDFEGRLITWNDDSLSIPVNVLIGTIRLLVLLPTISHLIQIIFFIFTLYSGLHPYESFWNDKGILYVFVIIRVIIQLITVLFVLYDCLITRESLISHSSYFSLVFMAKFSNLFGFPPSRIGLLLLRLCLWIVSSIDIHYFKSDTYFFMSDKMLLFAALFYILLITILGSSDNGQDSARYHPWLDNICVDKILNNAANNRTMGTVLFPINLLLYASISSICIYRFYIGFDLPGGRINYHSFYEIIFITTLCFFLTIRLAILTFFRVGGAPIPLRFI